MPFPPANPADVFNRLGRDETVFHIGPGTGKALLNAYRKCAAAFVISEPDVKLAAGLKAALLSSDSVELIYKAVTRDGVAAELHRYSMSAANTLTRAGEVAPKVRGTRHIDSVSVQTLKPEAFLELRRKGQPGSDVLVVDANVLHLGVLIHLGAVKALSGFEHIVVRYRQTDETPEQLDEITKLLQVGGFDALAMPKSSAEQENLVLFRRNRLADEVDRLNSIVRSHEDEIQALRVDRVRAEAMEVQAYEAINLTEAHKSEVAAQRKRIAELQVVENELKSEFSSLECQLKEANNTIKAGDRKISATIKKLERANQRAKDYKQAQKKAKMEQDEIRALHEELLRTISEHDATNADLKHQLAAQLQQRDEISARSEKLATEVIELREQTTALKREAADSAAQWQEDKERLAELTQNLVETCKSRDEGLSKLDVALRLQSSLRDDLGELQARYGELLDGKQKQDELVGRLIKKLSLAKQSPMSSK